MFPRDGVAQKSFPSQPANIGLTPQRHSVRLLPDLPGCFMLSRKCLCRSSSVYLASLFNPVNSNNHSHCNPCEQVVVSTMSLLLLLLLPTVIQLLPQHWAGLRPQTNTSDLRLLVDLKSRPILTGSCPGLPIQPDVSGKPPGIQYPGLCMKIQTPRPSQQDTNPVDLGSRSSPGPRQSCAYSSFRSSPIDTGIKLTHLLPTRLSCLGNKSNSTKRSWKIACPKFQQGKTGCFSFFLCC